MQIDTGTTLGYNELMRIAIFSECYTPVTNGVVTSICNLRDTLLAWGHSVYVFAPGTPQPDDDDTIFRLPALPFPRHPYRFARPFPHLTVNFKSLQVQVIHSQHPFTVGRLGAHLAHRYGLPMVYTVHSLYDDMAAASQSALVRRMGQPYARRMMRRYCAKADYVIAPSRLARDALLTDGVRAHFVVVPSGAAPPIVSVEGRARVRALLGIKAETPLLLYVGRLGPEKRVDLLLRAVVELKTRDLPGPLAGFRLVIVGDGQCRADWEGLAAELGVQQEAIFVGAKPHAEIGDWYAAADLFTLSSPAETQGLVLIEAMGAGLPCVAVAEGGALEVIELGETGLLTPFEPAAFADAIHSLLIDPALCRKMGANGRIAAQKYTPEAMAHEVLRVYEQALALPRPPTRSKAFKPNATR